MLFVKVVGSRHLHALISLGNGRIHTQALLKKYWASNALIHQSREWSQSPLSPTRPHTALFVSFPSSPIAQHSPLIPFGTSCSMRKARWEGWSHDHVNANRVRRTSCERFDLCSVSLCFRLPEAVMRYCR